MAKAKPQFTQCKLARKDEGSRIETTSWIPTKVKSDDGMVKLRLGMVVDLKKEDDTWTRDWTVETMSAPVDEPPDVRKLIRGHRKMTGDSMPRRTEG